MKEIKLTRGYVAQVDDADFDWLNQWNWYAQNGRRTMYAARKLNGGAVMVLMHRVILPVHRSIIVDHIDGDGLNNQRYNLRSATHRDNTGNRIGYSATGVKGVSINSNGRYQAQITKNNRQEYLGLFDTIEEAAAAYAEAARAYFGEFAFTTEEEQKGTP